MTRRPFLIGFFLLVIALPAFAGELPQVLAPNTTAYSAEQVAVLTQAMEALEDMLNDDSLGSRKTPTADGWRSRDFANYTAGRLSEFGYDVMLVSRSDRPDAVLPGVLQVWVLVAIPLDGHVAWVPVEATPELGKLQQTLGLIPSTRDEEGKIWFEEGYVSFSEAIDLPENLPPVAKIRAAFKIVAKSEEKFRATGSYDPDGEIVLYCWDFGDGATETVVTSTARHRYEEPDYYRIALTVIDDLGASMTVSITRRVAGGEAGATGCPVCGG